MEETFLGHQNYKIINNWLEPIFCNFLYEKFLFHTPHFFDNYSQKNSVKESNNFYSSPLSNDEHILFLKYKLKNDFFYNYNIVEILRVYLNIQHQGMNGDFHQDDGNMTCLFFPGPSLNCGGEFEIKLENNDIIKIPYINNQLVMFNSSLFHRGLAFTIRWPRLTLAFKCNVIK
jgi:hypothetical protein